MTAPARQIVQKLWSYCNVLRDDGLSYGDYVEQLTYLLFLKMAHERSQPPWKQPSPIPKGFDWPSLLARDGDELETHYRHVLEELGKRRGMLGIIFRKAQNKVQDPAKLRRLIADLIDRETWTRLDADVKGDAYEGLLEKNAQDTKGGAGQYFTPRPLIRAIVECIRPAPGERICDPACGTGGFLLAAHDDIAAQNPNLDRDQKRHLKLAALSGVEIVDAVARLCAMNLLLHGIGPSGEEAPPPISSVRTSTSSSPATTRKTAAGARPPGARTGPTGGGAPSPTRSWSPATRRASTSSGSRTRAWRTPTTSPIPRCSPPRSSRTCAPPWSSSSRSRRT
jgi:type I restriction enzyme M protein